MSYKVVSAHLKNPFFEDGHYEIIGVLSVFDPF